MDGLPAIIAAPPGAAQSAGMLTARKRRPEGRPGITRRLGQRLDYRRHIVAMDEQDAVAPAACRPRSVEKVRSSICR